MSVLKRMNMLVRSNLNDLSSRLGRRDMLREVDTSLREAKTQQVEARAMERRQLKQYEALLDEGAEWEHRAELALRAGDEGLARQALARKQKVLRRANAIKETLDEQQAYLIDLERSMQAIEVKFDGMRDHQRALGGTSATGRSPSRYARSDRTLADAELGSLGDRETFDKFDAMADRISDAEAQFEAMRELSGESDGATRDGGGLEDRFRQLEAGRQLKQLKRKSTKLDELRRRLEEE